MTLRSRSKTSWPTCRCIITFACRRASSGRRLAKVNSRIPPMTDGKKSINASAWLDANAPVEQATWAPGKSMLIYDKVISDGGWIDQPRLRY